MNWMSRSSSSTWGVVVELLSVKLPTSTTNSNEVYCHFSWAVIGKDRKMFALLKSLVTYESTSTVTQGWPPQAHVYCPCATPRALYCCCRCCCAFSKYRHITLQSADLNNDFIPSPAKLLSCATAGSSSVPDRHRFHPFPVWSVVEVRYVHLKCR